MIIDLAAALKARNLRSRIAAAAVLLLACPAQAQPLDPAIEISARANLLLDAAAARSPPSQPASGNATQDAVVSAIVAGRRSAAGVTAALAVSGDLPQGGMLSGIGDGVGIDTHISGRYADAPAQTDGLYGEYDIELRNRSAGARYKVTLKIDYANQAAAQGTAAEGAGAYSTGLITLGSDSGELFSSSLTSDTTLGDRLDVTSTGSRGQPLADSAVRSLDLQLGPGEAMHLHGRHEMRGSAAAPGAAYRGALRAFISVAAVLQLGAGPGQAAPQTAAKAAPKADSGRPETPLPQWVAYLALALLPLLAWLWRRLK